MEFNLDAMKSAFRALHPTSTPVGIGSLSKQSFEIHSSPPSVNVVNRRSLGHYLAFREDELNALPRRAAAGMISTSCTLTN